MKIGDLVKFKDDHELGFVMRIDYQYYGARQAYKVTRPLPRGKCIRSNMVDSIGPTKKGVRHRVLVMWNETGYRYCDSSDLEVISESR